MVSVREHTFGSGFVLVVWIGCGFVMGLLVWMLQVRPHWQALALQSEYVELVAVNDSFITTEYMITSLYVGGGAMEFLFLEERKVYPD
jgi:hypothetical protein